MTGIPSNLSLINQRLQQIKQRHAVASHNITNINTPGFKAQEVTFEKSLNDASGSRVQIKVQDQQKTSTRLDGNTVDIDQEIGQLTKNSLMHNALTQILASKVRQMQSAITGR